MKTRYLVTSTDPDELDFQALVDRLDNCEGFRSQRAARKEYVRRVNGGTNMPVFLLEVKLVEQGQYLVSRGQGRLK